MNHIKIINYLPEHQPYFEKLNKAWIEKDFTLEERDKFILEQPDESILKPGGAILLATYDGIIAGTVALLKLNSFEYEFTKMAVDEKYRRKGIAEQLSYAAIEKAKQLGAKNIILYSQTVLTGAVPLYKKVGFVQIPIDKGRVYKRADVKMEMMLEVEAMSS
ncbi:MAG: GNAT family N-acetyltransferase [Flavisolibacter sp.]